MAARQEGREISSVKENRELLEWWRRPEERNREIYLS
jgi:hypothetical protein